MSSVHFSDAPGRSRGSAALACWQGRQASGLTGVSSARRAGVDLGDTARIESRGHSQRLSFARLLFRPVLATRGLQLAAQAVDRNLVVNSK